MKINKISASLFFIFLVILISCSKNLEESAKIMKESKNLEGIWQYTYSKDKDTVNNDIESLPFVKFEGNSFVVSKNEQIVQRGTYKVLLDKYINKMNITIISGEKKGTKYKAIYKFTGDSLVTINYGKNNYPKKLDIIEEGFIIKLEKIK